LRLYKCDVLVFKVWGFKFSLCRYSAGNTVATGARVTSVLGKICHPGPGKTIPTFPEL
jgi:hypothetical protein